MAGFRRAKASLVPLALVTLGTLLIAACGAQGTQGTQGVQGPQGPQGAQGIQGGQGPVGPPIAAGDVQRLVQPMVIQIVPQMKGESGVQGPQGIQGPQGPQGPAFAEQARLALDKRAYLAHDEKVVGDETITILGDESIAVYGSGFVADEFVLPQILGANPRGFKAEGVHASANGTFSTTIALLTGGNRVQPGVYTLRVTGGEGTLMTIPVVIADK